ncbi:DNA-binding transcriptional LysR family regulator [Ereboglobus sp. PH5-5]|uniref:LysR family transcriptional regulator n=1 Tax=Ereboglobus sp. PH5-5 TaxID=2940529 RepID=UPI00240679C9|nr:LysR family transcriptional regulator [Ereboglobus sp. PH5-5]MDF9832796.1 DNA-binding transcriptional LysR family regulator [Ereboglobus sp. PH5-5]
MFEKLFAERGLSLDRLRVLVEVHDAGSIAQAAPGDLIRQSQYSRQLREISEFFGCEVARRRGKLLKLSARGARLAELARAQLRALEDFRSECREESIDYTIAAGDSLIHWFVIPKLGALVSEFGDKARFVTVNLRTNEIVQQLCDGRVDFGVIRKDALTDGLKSASLGTLAYAGVVPAALFGGPARAAKQKIGLVDVLGGALPLAAQMADGQFTQRLREVAAKVGVEMKPALVCQSFPQTLAAVRSGGFAAVLPAIALRDMERGSFVEANAPELGKLKRDLVLAWNPRTEQVRPNARKLAERLRAALKL